MVVWEDGSIMLAFTGCDADIATRVTSMGYMTGMVFSLLRKHRQSPQTLGAQWQQAASLESNIYIASCVRVAPDNQFKPASPRRTVNRCEYKLRHVRQCPVNRWKLLMLLTAYTQP